MIKMKRLIRSLIIASGGLFLAATASNAASISFAPTGEQLDKDRISDIKTATGEVLEFAIISESFQLFSDVWVNFAVKLDTTELKFLNSSGLPVLELFLRVPKDKSVRTNFKVEVLDGLNNDGDADLSLLFKSAYFPNISGEPDLNSDVSESFGFKRDVNNPPVVQDVEVQPVPEPTTIFGSTLALGVGGWLKRKKSSQQNKTTSH